MNRSQLEACACSLAVRGKGILAADESFPTIEKRFKSVGLTSTEENRRAYREMLFTTPGLGEFIDGAILFDETMRQKTRDGTPLPEVLARHCILPGIKVDKGTVPLAGFPGEKITEGLDGLRARLEEYRTLGARFAKWRAVIVIGANPTLPTRTCIRSNAELLARYAALSQEADLTPIVEPEVLMDGAHSLARCEEVTEMTLRIVFKALYEHRVFLEGTLLKPNMVLPGKTCPEKASVEQVADATLRCLRRTVPVTVPGIVFLSGGQTPCQATEHLNALNERGPHPWALSFSYGRALQDPVLAVWRADAASNEAAQLALFHRARCNGSACQGSYSRELETNNALPLC